MTSPMHPANWPAGPALGVIWIVYLVLLVVLAPFTPFAILLMVGPLIATGWYARHWAIPLGVGLAHGAALAGLTWWLGAFDSWPAGTFALAATILMLMSWFTALAGRTVWIMQDLRRAVWERDEAEMTLADTAANTQAIYEASTVALVALDAEARIVSWNPGAESVFGRSAGSMVGKPFQDLAAEGDPDDCMGPIRYALETQREIPAFAGRLVHGDGYLLDVEVKARPVDGHARLILTIMDHTREHDIEDALITQSEMHDRLLKNLDEVMYSVDVPSMHTQFLTKTVEELTGQPPGKFADFGDLLARAHPDDVEAVERRWRHARTGERSTLRWRIQNPEGGHWWVEDRVLPVRNEEGTVVRLDGILRRIYREIELERQALRMTQWLDALEPLAGSGAWSLDLRTGEWQWSAGMHNIMGTDPHDEVTADVWHRLIPPDAMDHILADPEHAGPVIVEAGHAQRMVLEPWLQRGNDGEPIMLYGLMRPAQERPERPKRRTPTPMYEADMTVSHETEAPMAEAMYEEPAVPDEEPFAPEEVAEAEATPEFEEPEPIEEAEVHAEAEPVQPPAEHDEEPGSVEMDVRWDDEFGWVPQPRKAEEIQAKTWPEKAKPKRKGPWALD